MNNMREPEVKLEEDFELGQYFTFDPSAVKAYKEQALHDKLVQIDKLQEKCRIAQNIIFSTATSPIFRY